MTFDEMKAIIAGSSIDDWNIIGPPTFLDSLGISTSGGDRWVLEVGSHYFRAAYKPDLSLGIAYGIDYMDGEELHFPWSSGFPDRRVTGQWADILWVGMPVHRELVLRVDGGRAILPVGEPEFAPSATESPMDAEQFAETVSQWKCDFARLVHSLERPPADFNRYLEMAGIVVED